MARTRSLASLSVTASVLALGATSALGASPSQAAPVAAPKAKPASLLFVQAASEGRLKRTSSGLRLSLRVSRFTQTFTDRPVRRAGRETTRRFVSRWRARGFRSDPPNAALSVSRARGGVGAVELRRPRYAKGWIHYSARPLKGSGKLRTGRFGAASLFIDNAPEAFCMSEDILNIEAELPTLNIPGCPRPNRRAILTVSLPPFSGSVTVNIVGGDASFSSETNYGSGPFGVNVNSPTSVNIGGCDCAAFTAYLPLFIQGNGESFQVTSSVPLQISRDDYNDIPVGPNQPGTFEFFPASPSS